jgi:hypothetical protein
VKGEGTARELAGVILSVEARVGVKRRDPEVESRTGRRLDKKVRSQKPEFRSEKKISA